MTAVLNHFGQTPEALKQEISNKYRVVTNGEVWRVQERGILGIWWNRTYLGGNTALSFTTPDYDSKKEACKDMLWYIQYDMRQKQETARAKRAKQNGWTEVKCDCE